MRSRYPPEYKGDGRLDKSAESNAIVIAAGSRPYMPDTPGASLPHVHWAADADMGKCAVGDSVVIIGGGSLGMESAVTQSSGGKKVTVIELRERLPLSGDSSELLEICKARGVEFFTGRRLLEIDACKITCVVLATGVIEQYPCDTVLVSAGMVARKDVVEELRHLTGDRGVYCR